MFSTKIRVKTRVNMIKKSRDWQSMHWIEKCGFQGFKVLLGEACPLIPSLGNLSAKTHVYKKLVKVINHLYCVKKLKRNF